MPPFLKEKQLRRSNFAPAQFYYIQFSARSNFLVLLKCTGDGPLYMPKPSKG